MNKAGFIDLLGLEHQILYSRPQMRPVVDTLWLFLEADAGETLAAVNVIAGV